MRLCRAARNVRRLFFQVLFQNATRLIEVKLLPVDDEDVFAGVGRDLVDVLNGVAVFTKLFNDKLDIYHARQCTRRSRKWKTTRPNELLYVGIGSAAIGGVLDGVEGEDGRLASGEKGDLQGVSSGIGNHPLNIFRSAETVLVQELLLGGNVEAIQAAGACRGAVSVEDGTDLGRLECTDPGHGRGGKVDGDLFVGKRDITGNASGGVGCGSPVAALLGLGCDETAEQE
jgi:hypothetical protein